MRADLDGTDVRTRGRAAGQADQERRPDGEARPFARPRRCTYSIIFVGSHNMTRPSRRSSTGRSHSGSALSDRRGTDPPSQREAVRVDPGNRGPRPGGIARHRQGTQPRHEQDRRTMAWAHAAMERRGWNRRAWACWLKREDNSTPHDPRLTPHDSAIRIEADDRPRSMAEVTPDEPPGAPVVDGTPSGEARDHGQRDRPPAFRRMQGRGFGQDRKASEPSMSRFPSNPRRDSADVIQLNRLRAWPRTHQRSTWNRRYGRCHDCSGSSFGRQPSFDGLPLGA